MRTAVLKSLILSISLVLIAGASENSGVATFKPKVDNPTASPEVYITIDGMLITEDEDSYISGNNSSARDNVGMTLDIPVNDNCADAIEIEPMQEIPFNTVEATVDGHNISTDPNVWYKYTATETRAMRVSIFRPREDTCGVAGGRVSVYDGLTCPESVELPDPIDLQGGETIETATILPNTLPVSINGYFTAEDIRDYTDCSCIMEQHGTMWTVAGDVVYSYTAASDDLVTFFLRYNETLAGMAMYDEDGNELRCTSDPIYRNDDGYGVVFYSVPVTQGETYYLVISDLLIEVLGSYNLSIYSQNYMLLERSSLGRQGCRNIQFDAVEGHEYLIEVSYVIESPCAATVLYLEPAPEPPANNICENAADLGVLEPGMSIDFTGDNTGATMECPYGSHWPEVWIKFTLEDSLALVRLEFCNNPGMDPFQMINSLLSRSCPPNSHDWIPAEEVGYVTNCPNASFLAGYRHLPAGTYYYPFLVHPYWEGSYAMNIRGYAYQECDEGSVYSHEPSVIEQRIVGTEFIYSDSEEGCAVVDKFENIGGSVNKITWWGIFGDADNGVSCEPTDPYPFNIVFLNISDTSPYLPGDTAAIYEVEVTPEETGYIMYEYTGYEAPQMKFVAYLPEEISLDNGWVMIHGNDGFNDCSFAWQNSYIGNNGLFYDFVESRWVRIQSGLAYCFDMYVDIDEEPSELPSAFELIGNYPNPFNATTLIQFSLENTEEANLSIYDILGRKIKTLHSGILSAGQHSFIWNGTNQDDNTVASGIYFYKLESPSGSYSKQMVLLK